jgi:peptidoglycan/LPS O-acetylase OafA/YrhL
MESSIQYAPQISSTAETMHKGSWEKPHVFLTLDALRGVAAIAVLGFHMHLYFGRQVFPQGYLAVDFFFMLSGFVLTYAYQNRLDNGSSTISFFKLRVARLYPLYLVGLATGFLYNFIQNLAGKGVLSVTNILVLLLAGLFMLPAVPEFMPAGPTIFPLNFPTWSLFYEIAANLFHALFLRRRNWIFLLSTIFVSGSAVVYSAVKFERLDFGADRSYFLYGFPRVIFSYTVGILLFRVWRSGKLRPNIPPIVSVLLLLSTLAAPIPHVFTVGYDLLIVIFVFPVLLLVSASSQPPSYLITLFQMLGISSYALYVLHRPMADFFKMVWFHLRRHTVEDDAPWSGLLFLAFIFALSLWIDRAYDLRARTFLRNKLYGRKS